MSERSNCKRGVKSCPRCLTGHFKKSARRHDRTVATRELRKLFAGGAADHGRPEVQAVRLELQLLRHRVLQAPGTKGRASGRTARSATAARQLDLRASSSDHTTSRGRFGLAEPEGLEVVSPGDR